MSKYNFLPPDGKVLNEPCIIDFDLIHILDGSKRESILKSKVLQLSSPFREQIAQRFAMHYMSIGIDDKEIKSSEHKNAIRKLFQGLESPKK